MEKLGLTRKRILVHKLAIFPVDIIGIIFNYLSGQDIENLFTVFLH